ncbi:MAG TPA: hypothetical protein VFZ06_01760 [Acidimicrobiia bacterium]|nr:hypothetical protein [Acidimicrobiia bacterium]
MNDVKSRTLANVRGSLVLAVMTALLVLGLAAPVAAADQVPFKGSLEGTVTITPLDPPFASVLIEGTGNATQLGRYSVEFIATVNQTTRQGVGPGRLVFTAANGDTLTAEGMGQATLVAPGVLSITETASITGGTGRFAGATGSFVIERTFFVAAGLTTGSFEGTMPSPG